jgi:NAD(P)-dependent dehydrogenase (short-subunit alcohol dehydrogenase family)
MDKIIVVTGGTGGIGQHTAIGLAKTGARVIVTGRSAERGAEAVAHIEQASGSKTVELVTGDLSTRAGVEALGDALLKRVDRIDVLINNAGMMAQERSVNDDGYELNFAINVVAPWVLAHRVKKALVAGAPSRVINVTGGKPAGPFDASDLQSERSFVPLVNYTMTKRAAEAMSLVLSTELETDGIFVSIVYPGRASTAMTQAMTPSSLPWFMRPAWPVFRFLIPKNDGGKSAALASRSSVFAATTDTLDGKAGQYIDTNQQVAALHPNVHDAGNQALVMAALKA